MKLYITVKQASSRKYFLSKKAFEFEQSPRTVGDLIENIVVASVNEFNDKIGTFGILDILTQREIEDQAITGKVGWGVVYNSKFEVVKSAVETAHRAYSDGLFKIFLNDQELGSLEDLVKLCHEDNLTCIRLTMLTGSMW